MAGYGRELDSPPDDGVTKARFSDHSNKLIVSSWDCTVRLYDVDENVLRIKFPHPAQVLDCCFQDDYFGLGVCSDRTVRRYDFCTGNENILGGHDDLVNCVEVSHVTGQIITGSWDKTLRVWDVRVASGDKRSLVDKHVQADAVESMSLVGYHLVVASGITTINVYDLRNMLEPMQQRESSLRYKTSCVRCYPNELGYAIGSVEGRIALEFFDLSEAGQANRYAFRCHPKSRNGRYSLVAVNAIEFHPIASHGTFVTGDNDGYSIVWDGKRKQRLHQYPKYPASIAALSYNRDGQLLVVASSYTYQEDEKMNELTQIFIQNVGKGLWKCYTKCW